MLTEICQEIHNWFNDDSEIQTGNFVISGGVLSLPFLQDGQYYRIVGSVFNDGVHKYGDDDSLTDETFTGAIWPMKSIPQEILELDASIDAWKEKNSAVMLSPYQSESWGGYSYTLKSGGSENGGGMSWQAAFSRQLNRWRKYQCL